MGVTLQPNMSALPGSAQALASLPWHSHDTPIALKPHPPADGVFGVIKNAWHSLFPPEDVRLAKMALQYQEKQALGDSEGSGHCAYALAGALWSAHRFLTAEKLWVEGAKCLLHNQEVISEKDIIERLRHDGHVSFETIVTEDAEPKPLVALQLGAGMQGTVKKVFGEDLVVKSPRTVFEMDPRAGPGIGARDMLRHRAEILGRELDAMRALAREGFAIASIHYVDPNFFYCLKSFINGPTHNSLSSYGLSADVVAIAEAKWSEFINRNPIVDNIHRNVVFDLVRQDWVIIDA